MPSDPDYPSSITLLEHAGGASYVLDKPVFLRGGLPDRAGICVVGTRRARPQALDFALALAERLVRAGYAVISGGARGIDAAAHQGALAAGGVTLAVLTGSLERPYPPEHDALFARIVAEGGGLLSLQSDDAERKRHHFHWRNGVMAALASATVVVEAPERSGTLSTVRAARRLHKPLFVVPAPPWDEAAAGNRAVVAAGGRPVWSLDQLLAELPPAVPPARGPLADEARALLGALAGGPARKHGDALCLQLGWAPGQLAMVGLELVLMGLVEEEQGWFRLR